MCPTGIVLTDSPYDSATDTLAEFGCKSTENRGKVVLSWMKKTQPQYVSWHWKQNIFSFMVLRVELVVKLAAKLQARNDLERNKCYSEKQKSNW